MTTKYSPEELNSLYRTALDQGWDTLGHGEKTAVNRWCRTEGLPTPLDILKQRRREQTAAETRPDPTPAPEPAVVKGRADIKALAAVEWVDGWPDDIDESPAHPSRWWPVSRALRRFPGRVARIESGATRKRAKAIMLRVRRGMLLGFKPAGSFRAEIAPHEGADGLWDVYAMKLDADQRRQS